MTSQSQMHCAIRSQTAGCKHNFFKKTSESQSIACLIAVLCLSSCLSFACHFGIRAHTQFSQRYQNQFSFDRCHLMTALTYHGEVMKTGIDFVGNEISNWKRFLAMMDITSTGPLTFSTKRNELRKKRTLLLCINFERWYSSNENSISYWWQFCWKVL